MQTGNIRRVNKARLGSNSRGPGHLETIKYGNAATVNRVLSAVVELVGRSAPIGVSQLNTMPMDLRI